MALMTQICCRPCGVGATAALVDGPSNGRCCPPLQPTCDSHKSQVLIADDTDADLTTAIVPDEPAVQQ